MLKQPMLIILLLSFVFVHVSTFSPLWKSNGLSNYQQHRCCDNEEDPRSESSQTDDDTKTGLLNLSKAIENGLKGIGKDNPNLLANAGVRAAEVFGVRAAEVFGVRAADVLERAVEKMCATLLSGCALVCLNLLSVWLWVKLVVNVIFLIGWKFRFSFVGVSSRSGTPAAASGNQDMKQKEEDSTKQK